MCPDDWHVPSDDDYIELEILLGMSSEDAMKIGWDRGSNQGNKLKDDLNWNGTNESGLSVVPGGFRAFNWGTDNDIENSSFLWTSSDANMDNSYGRSFSLDDSTIARNSFPKNNGFSVRCIADSPGCMHPNGTNYDPSANVDDGSCEYEVAQIGHQVWMTENLKATNYLNGDEIETGYNHQEWIALEKGAFAFVDNEALNTDIYGILYNGYAVNDDRGICPDRWHMPTESDWNQLILFLDNNADTNIVNGAQSLIAGGKMKSIGNIEDGDGFFRSPNIGATNESGFNAVPGGFVGGDETEIYFGSQNALYWAYDSYYFRNVTYSSEKIDIGIWSENPMAWGMSVRCLRDEIQVATIFVPENFPTIQEAIDYSIDGDTIFVSSGTYYENINFNGKNIVLIGEDRETTIIDGSGNGSVVTFFNEEDAMISEFTIQFGSSNEGGGIYLLNSSPIISNCNIEGNHALDTGGGIFGRNSSPKIIKCLFNSNSAGVEGAAIKFLQNSNLEIINSTIVNNQGSCSLIKSDNFGKIEVANSIIWNNDSSIFCTYNDGIIDVKYSNIQGGWDGEGNINIDPQFADPEHGDYALQQSSPCIDSGDPSSSLDPDETIVDMGAYFFDQDPPIYGCNDELACNFDFNVTDNDGSCEYAFENYDCDGNCLPELIDCNGDCGGDAVFDDCEVCDADISNDCVQDCTGEWGGDAELDECGICDSSMENNCFGYSLQLNPGANLKSFYALPVNDSISNIFMSMSESVSGVITEGGAASQIAPGLWVGSIHEIDSLKGYWIITALEEGKSLIINDAIAMDVNSEYNLHSGANLISYPSRNSASLDSSFPDDIEFLIEGIITEGEAANQISPGVWVGSLDEFEAGKGYWFISSSNINFSFIID